MKKATVNGNIITIEKGYFKKNAQGNLYPVVVKQEVGRDALYGTIVYLHRQQYTIDIITADAFYLMHNSQLRAYAVANLASERISLNGMTITFSTIESMQNDYYAQLADKESADRFVEAQAYIKKWAQELRPYLAQGVDTCIELIESQLARADYDITVGTNGHTTVQKMNVGINDLCAEGTSCPKRTAWATSTNRYRQQSTSDLLDYVQAYVYAKALKSYGFESASHNPYGCSASDTDSYTGETITDAVQLDCTYAGRDAEVAQLYTDYLATR